VFDIRLFTDQIFVTRCSCVGFILSRIFDQLTCKLYRQRSWAKSGGGGGGGGVIAGFGLSLSLVPSFFLFSLQNVTHNKHLTHHLSIIALKNAK